MPTYHLHIKGRVQGVGFRPFVYRIAREMELNGWVSNTLDGVHIKINGNRDCAERLVQIIQEEKPAQSIITAIHLDLVRDEPFKDFEIIASDHRGIADLLITPDFAMCGECRKEINEAENRRFHYPFTTCTNCGPRYSIIEALPYDRPFTTMLPFEMCDDCLNEYTNLEDRRYFSQTNSCPNCPVTMEAFRGGQSIGMGNHFAIREILRSLYQGEIVAVKGIGGYLLLCDATDERPIRLLRDRKRRPEKPFALLYPNIDLLKEDAEIGPTQVGALESVEAPICLVPVSHNQSGLALGEIAPGLQQIGVMLPYTPLFSLIADAFQKPLVATSGNISGSPIIYQDDQAQQVLSNFADLVVTNDRKIVVSQDDSVLRHSPFYEIPITIRRSRGMAPSLLEHGLAFPDHSILAFGSDLKGAFALNHGQNLYLSQYLGDLENFDAQLNFEHTLDHLLQLFKAVPEKILIDQHPQYFSSNLGTKLARESNKPLETFQHHEAHFGAILGEHQLWHQDEPVLGFVWDGSGWGTDDQVWGGESFVFRKDTILRAHHLDYFPHLAGDKMAREPRLSRLALFDDPDNNDLFTTNELDFYRKLASSPARFTSSMGRLFDAVASYLGLIQKSTFEGQAAMLLEEAAMSYFKTHGLNQTASYYADWSVGALIDLEPLVHGIKMDVQRGLAVSKIAAKFHVALVELIAQIACYQSIEKLAFSGGVFQNSLLVDLLMSRMSGPWQLYFHQKLSPNDENIAYGQMVLHLARISEAYHPNRTEIFTYS